MCMRDIKKAFNSFTSRNIGKFTHAGMLTNASNGEHCGGVPPLGYNVVDKKLVINESEAEIVRRIFDMYENNFSYKQMAEDLNSKGYRTKFGQLFTYNSFSSKALSTYKSSSGFLSPNGIAKIIIGASNPLAL